VKEIFLVSDIKFVYGTPHRANFSAIILKFESKGEKTGWTYIKVPKQIALVIKPNYKKSFRVQGMLDKHPIKGVTLLPMGECNYIMPLNATMRKAIKKGEGDTLAVQIMEYRSPRKIDKEFNQCLLGETKAYMFFKLLPKSHQFYFSNWIASAKTVDTKAKRIAQSIDALQQKQKFGDMVRALKEKKKNL
jgi:hypothetical protein